MPPRSLGGLAVTRTRDWTARATARRWGGSLTRVVLATLAILLGLVATAEGRTTVSTGAYEEGLFYKSFEQDVVLFAGGTAEDACTGDEPVHQAKFREEADGTVVITVAPKVERPLYLYATPLGPPEFLDVVCPAVAAGDPAPEPFATGVGRMKLRLEIAPDGDVHIVNTSWGTVRGDDGQRWRVRGRADLMVVDGAPVGSPEDFQRLQIVRQGR